MKLKTLLGGVAVCAVLFAGAANAQSGSVNQATAWQFRDANTTATLQNNLALIAQREALRNPSLSGGGLSGGSGLVGASAANTNNYFQSITETNVSNNCSASAAGASLSCSGSGGGNTAGANQTTQGTTNSSSTDLTGNSITSTPQTTVNSNNNGTNSLVANAGAQ